jgi:hypothetical protein
VAAQLGKPRLHLGIGESRIDLGVELVDDRGWRVFRRADAGPEAKLINLLTSGRQDDGLAGRLRVEEPVGFLGLLEPPAVREEPLHVHLPVAMNSAHSAWPCFENVHGPTSVTCRRRRSGLTSSVT